MGTTVMSFSRSAGNYVTYVTQKKGDTIEFATTETPSFPANTKATYVDVYIAKGLKSGSGNYRACEIAVEFKVNGTWYEVWSGERSLSGDGGDGTVEISSIPVSAAYQTEFATHGVEKIRIRQDGDYAIKGMSTAYGTATFTYEAIFTRCTEPETVTIEKNITAAATNMLSWSEGGAGVNNAVSGYFIQYMDSADNDSWDGWKSHPTQPTGVVNSFVVDMPAPNMYRLYKVWTLGAAGSEWRSANGTESSSSTYRGHADLDGFTDSPLVAGESYVKALHMQELQDRTNTLREFYGMSRYDFSVIVGGETGLKNWTEHVNEIRTAVDEINTEHDAWITFNVNCPRADVIEQLRAVILAM